MSNTNDIRQEPEVPSRRSRARVPGAEGSLNKKHSRNQGRGGLDKIGDEERSKATPPVL